MAFGNRAPQPMKGTREYYERNYNVCRMNFLAVITFTVISIISLMTSDTYFLFSNYFAVEMAYVGLMYVTGGWQNWEDAGEISEVGQEFLSVMGAGYIAIAAVILIVLAICWLLSKKSRIPMIVAAVIMGFDTIYVLLMFDIINIVFHAWVMYYLITAIRDWGKMQALPEGDGMVFEGADQNGYAPYGNAPEANMNNPYGAPVNMDSTYANDSTEATEASAEENADGQNVEAVETEEDKN